MQKAVCSFNREQAAFWRSINIWLPAKRDMGVISMEIEQLAFIITKELGVDKPDVDLIKSIRKNKELYFLR